MSPSFVSALEPLLGGGLALNLAYLYLQWFYYLEKIGQTAVKARGKLADSNVILEQNKDKRSVQCVDYLVSLGMAGDEGGGKSVKARFKGKFPCLPWDKVWSYPLLTFFVTKLDRAVAMIGTGIIMCLLIIGVGHDTGVYENYLVTPGEKTKSFIFSIVCIAFIWPVGMAITAWIVRGSVARFVKETVGTHAMEMQSAAQKQVSDAPTE